MSALSRLPYPGLRAFVREESDLFFGRDGCVDAMVDRLAATRFLAVLGPSGSGKSSLVRTGLLEALDLGLHSAAGSRWWIADMQPGGAPLRNLAAALLRARDGNVPDEGEVTLMTKFLARGPRSVSEWAAGGNLPADRNLLILVDQFEELFRYGDYAEREEAEAFAALLLETAAEPKAKLHVVLTMRSEFIGACSLLPGLAERVNKGIYLTPRMSREECREAIEGPARVLGFRVEPDLVNRLLNDLASFAPWETNPGTLQADQLARRADQLPLMQHVLNRLWMGAKEEAGEGIAELKLAAYEECGGLSGAIDKHAAEIMASLGDRAPQVETVFRALISGTSPATAVRRPCPMRELIEVLDSRRDAVAVVEAFSAADSNFLRTSSRSLEERTIVDISHESLIRQWTSLREWLEREARDAAEWTRLRTAQERHAAHKEELLSRLNLHSLAAWFEEVKPTEGWAARYGGNFKAAVAFLDESREAEEIRTDRERRRERRERNLLRAGVGTLGVLVLAIAFLFQQNDKAKTKALSSARMTVDILQKFGSTLQQDEFVSLLGFSKQQSRLNRELLNQERNLVTAYGSLLPAANRVRTLYQVATALDEEGRAVDAMKKYKEAYELGMSEIKKAKELVSDELKILVIQDAARSAWRLYDTGRTGEADEVVKNIERLIHPGHSETDEWHSADATLHSLLARRHREKKEYDQADRYLQDAVKLMEPITDRALSKFEPTPSMDQMRVAYWVQMSRLRSAQNDAAKIDSATKACALARAMFEKNPMDRRAINAHVWCMVGTTTRSSDPAQARRDAEEASTLVDAALVFSPHDQSMLLLRAQVRKALADNGDPRKRRQYLTDAKDDFVEVLKDGTLFLTSSLQVRELYQGFAATERSDVGFYTRVRDAATEILRTFPDAPAFQEVERDASSRIAQLQSARPRRLVANAM